MGTDKCVLHLRNVFLNNIVNFGLCNKYKIVENIVLFIYYVVHFFKTNVRLVYEFMPKWQRNKFRKSFHFQDSTWLRNTKFVIEMSVLSNKMTLGCHFISFAPNKLK